MVTLALDLPHHKVDTPIGQALLNLLKEPHRPVLDHGEKPSEHGARSNLLEILITQHADLHGRRRRSETTLPRGSRTTSTTRTPPSHRLEARRRHETTHSSEE